MNVLYLIKKKKLNNVGTDYKQYY